MLNLSGINLSPTMDRIAHTLGPRVTTSLAVAVAYVAVCRSLRFRRRNYRAAQLPYKTREDFKNMTAEDAWTIVKYITALEFPWISVKALAFALFK